MYHVMMKIAKFKILSSEYPACAGEDGARGLKVGFWSWIAQSESQLHYLATYVTLGKLLMLPVGMCERQG